MDDELMRVIKTAKSDILRFSDAYGPNGLRAMRGSPCAQLADLMAKEVGSSGPWDDSDALMAGPVAGALLKASSDYLAGAIALVEGGQIGPPIAPVIRAMFEAMGRAAWLLDPNQDNARIWSSRFRLLWLDDLKRQQELRRAVDQKNEAATTEKVRRKYKKETFQRFTEDEYRMEARGTGQILILCGQDLTLTSSVRALEMFGVGEWATGRIYDALSVLSHPTIAPLALGHFNPEYEHLALLLLGYASALFRQMSDHVANFLGLPPFLFDATD